MWSSAFTPGLLSPGLDFSQESFRELSCPCSSSLIAYSGTEWTQTLLGGLIVHSPEEKDKGGEAPCSYTVVWKLKSRRQLCPWVAPRFSHIPVIIGYTFSVSFGGSSVEQCVLVVCVPSLRKLEPH